MNWADYMSKTGEKQVCRRPVQGEQVIGGAAHIRSGRVRVKRKKKGKEALLQHRKRGRRWLCNSNKHTYLRKTRAVIAATSTCCQVARRCNPRCVAHTKGRSCSSATAQLPLHLGMHPLWLARPFWRNGAPSPPLRPVHVLFPRNFASLGLRVSVFVSLDVVQLCLQLLDSVAGDDGAIVRHVKHNVGRLHQDFRPWSEHQSAASACLEQRHQCGGAPWPTWRLTAAAALDHRALRVALLYREHQVGWQVQAAGVRPHGGQYALQPAFQVAACGGACARAGGGQRCGGAGGQRFEKLALGRGVPWPCTVRGRVEIRSMRSTGKCRASRHGHFPGT